MTKWMSKQENTQNYIRNFSTEQQITISHSYKESDQKKNLSRVLANQMIII